MTSLPKVSDQPLPQLYHLEHDKVPSRLQQQLQMEPIDDAAAIHDKTSSNPIESNVTDSIDTSLTSTNESESVGCESARPKLTPPPPELAVYIKTDPLEKSSAEVPTMTATKSIVESTHAQDPNHADDSSDLCLGNALECDETYIDRSTSSADLDGAIKSEPHGALPIEDDCLSEKQSPYSADAVSEDRTSVNELDAEDDCEEVEFGTSKETKTLTIELVGEVINRLRQCRSRTDKPRVTRILQKACGMTRKQVVVFLNQAIDNKQLERARYREYFGLRLFNPNKLKVKEEPIEPFELDKEESVDAISDESLLELIIDIMHETVGNKKGEDCESIAKLLQDKTPSVSCTSQQIQNLLQEQIEKKSGTLFVLSL
jgi:hypothetical protein